MPGRDNSLHSLCAIVSALTGKLYITVLMSLYTVPDNPAEPLPRKSFD